LYFYRPLDLSQIRKSYRLVYGGCIPELQQNRSRDINKKLRHSKILCLAGIMSYALSYSTTVQRRKYFGITSDLVLQVTTWGSYIYLSTAVMNQLFCCVCPFSSLDKP